MQNLFILLFLVVCTSCGAQKGGVITTEQPIRISGESDNQNAIDRWTYEIVALELPNEYMVTANLKLDKGWHIFDFEPGGDGLLVAPEVHFASKDITVLEKGAVGELITAKLAGMDQDVRYYENEVSFKVRVRSKKKEIKGSMYYQLCDHEKCLAPTENSFVLLIK